jgi:hypothetical protein
MLLCSQTLRDRGIEGCLKDASYHSRYTSAAALSIGASSIDFPSRLRRNTVAYFGPSSGILVGKNSIVELNDVHHSSDLQKGGSLLQSAAHDFMEENEGGWTKAWAPTLCTDFNNHDKSSSAIVKAWKSCTNPAMKGCIWVSTFVPLPAYPLMYQLLPSGFVREVPFVLVTTEVTAWRVYMCASAY